MHNNKCGEVFEKRFLGVATRVKRIALSCQSIEDSISWGKLYGRLMSDNHSMVVRDDELERDFIARYIASHEFVFKNNDLSKELHVITEAYSSGGHTRLLERLVSIRPNCDVVVVRGGEDNLRLPEGVNVHSIIGGYDIHGLIERFCGYKRIFLYLHPDDLLTSVAVGVVKQKQDSFVVFVNHADHIFSFGYYVADVVAEVSRFGYKLSMQRRHVACGFLGVPLEISGLKYIPWKKFGSDLHIFSAGSPSKFKPAGECSFQAVLNKLLVVLPQVSITIIGPRLATDWWWWSLKLRFGNRLRLVESLPYEKYIAELKACDLYLDSYPMTGGTALPEVRSINILVAGISCGSSGYTPFDRAKFDSVDNLIGAIRSLFVQEENPIWLLNNNLAVLSRALYVHGIESVRHRLQSLLDRDLVRLRSDELVDIDIEFYNRNWKVRHIVSLSTQDVFALLKHSSGMGVAGKLIFGFGVKNCLVFLVLVISKILAFRKALSF